MNPAITDCKSMYKLVGKGAVTFGLKDFLNASSAPGWGRKFEFMPAYHEAASEWLSSDLECVKDSYDVINDGFTKEFLIVFEDGGYGVCKIEIASKGSSEDSEFRPLGIPHMIKEIRFDGPKKDFLLNDITEHIKQKGFEYYKQTIARKYNFENSSEELKNLYLCRLKPMTLDGFFH